MNILVTGGAGFIGSALIRFLIKQTNHKVLNYDKLTYAGNLKSLSKIDESENYKFIFGDINDKALLECILNDFKPNIIFNLAAETHVDRSINQSEVFIKTNICGTYNLIEVCRDYWSKLNNLEKEKFRFIHISTDEVFGSLGESGKFSETTPYDPSSPYSASKAASDLLVKAWHKTYNFPIIITNCSNNFGPYQYPEKLIPLSIINAIQGNEISLYGDGKNVRDWLYVNDHAYLLFEIAQKGMVGETYNIGANNELQNIHIIEKLCEILDKKLPNNAPHFKLVKFVDDRLGHDRRYAIDASKLKNEVVDFKFKKFEFALEETVDFYLNNIDWWRDLLNKKQGL